MAQKTGHRTERFMDVWVVTESELIQDARLLSDFRESLREVRDELERVQGKLQLLTEEHGSDAEELHGQLTDVGLTGNHLRLKERVLDWVLSVTGANIRHVLKWMNSFLGSLSKVFPKLEIVKEYKEHLEVIVGHRRRRPPQVPKSIFDIR